MPIVTLSSDIGQQDYLIGAIKGQLLSCNAAYTIVDITHYLMQTNFPQAAYSCSNAFKYFPEKTFHIVLLNVFASASQKILITKHNNQFIICADNGILTLITQNKPTAIVALHTNKEDSFLALTQKIATSITEICNGKTLNEVGDVVNEIVETNPLRATTGADWIEGQVLYIDHFENVIINITKEEFEEQRRGRSFKIVFKRNETINHISNNYASVIESEKLAFFNSAGYLEIALNKGNMAGLFGLQSFNEQMNRQLDTMQNKWFYQTVRIFFE